MTTNKYFNNPDHTDTGFQAEWDKLVIESIQERGHDVFYIPRTVINEDHLFGEDTISLFENEGCIEMYIESVDGYEGDKEFISKFGFEIRDQIVLVVSRTRWEQESIGDLVRPRDGDLIYLPISKDLFEVRFSDDDAFFYSQNKNFTYRLTCEKFDYSHEDFNTGIPEVDSLEDRFENIDDSSNDPFADNIDIQIDSDELFDFNESDPFGDF